VSRRELGSTIFYSGKGREAYPHLQSAGPDGRRSRPQSVSVLVCLSKYLKGVTLQPRNAYASITLSSVKTSADFRILGGDQSGGLACAPQFAAGYASDGLRHGLNFMPILCQQGGSLKSSSLICLKQV
jgi:hypothetical protein